MLDQTKQSQFLSSLFSEYMPHRDNNVCGSPNLHVTVPASSSVKPWQNSIVDLENIPPEKCRLHINQTRMYFVIVYIRDALPR